MSQDDLPQNIKNTGYSREVRIDSDGRLVGSSGQAAREVRIGPDGRVIKAPKQPLDMAQQPVRTQQAKAPVPEAKPKLSAEEQQKILADNSGPTVADNIVKAQTGAAAEAEAAPAAVAAPAPVEPVVAQAPAVAESVAATTGVTESQSAAVGSSAGEGAMASAAGGSSTAGAGSSSSFSGGLLPALGGIGLLALAGGGGSSSSSSSSAAAVVQTLLSGSVADGYINGAKIYVDLDNDGLADTNENTNIVTNQSGAFSGNTTLAVSGHAILAVGGADTSTGLHNAFMVLKAPVGATVINPLTTLVQAYMDTHGGVTAAAATTAVANALGLSGVNLLTYNPLANSGATALAVQQAAAQVAAIATIAANDAGTLNALTTSNAVLDNLANAITSGSSLNLTNTTLLTSVLTGSGVVTSAATLATTVSTANTSIAAATSVAAVTAAQIQYASDLADTVAPLAAGTPDLLDSSDSGSNTSDNVTTDTTPTVQVAINATATDGTAVVPGDILNVYVNGVSGASAYTLTATDIANGYANVTLSTLAAGTYAITAKLTDQVGNVSSASGTLNITIESSAPPTLLGFAPVDDATAVDVASNIYLTFDKTVQAGSGNIVISNGTDTRTISVTDTWQVTFSGNTVTINPLWGGDLQLGSTYSVTMAAGVITDAYGNAYAGISDSTLFNFTTGTDNAAPTLIYSAPVDNATAVAVDGKIVLTFSEAIKAGTGNIVISDGASAQTIPIGDIFGQVAISGNTLTIDPMWNLQPNTTYYVQMASGVLTDLAGNSYAGISDATTLNFTTVNVSAPDTVAPVLSSSSPVDGATAVTVGSDVVLTFSETVQAGTGNIVISNGTDSRSISVTDATQVTISGNTVTINPSANLNPGGAYYVQMASGVLTDASGNAYAGIGDTTTLNFTTATSGTPPLLSSATPADNATGIVATSNIVLTFDKAIQAGTGNIVISNGTDTQTIPINDIFGQISISGSTLTINPMWDLQSGSTYYVQMASGVITDTSGNPYAGISDTTTLNFTTLDSTLPTLTASSPADNATAVAVGSNIVLTFSETVQAGVGNIVISDGTDTRTISVADATQVTISGNTVTLNPSADLNPNATYYVQMGSGVLTDTAGNAYAGISDTTTLNFSTSDTLGPMLTSSLPADGATVVAVGNNIVITFNEAVQFGTGNIVVSNGTDTQTIDVANSWGQATVSGSTLTINPIWDLQLGSTYYVQMASGVITDLVGNAYAGISDTTTLNFTTGTDVTAPTLSSSAPADNATAVAVGDNIVLTFNEQIKVGTGFILLSDGGADVRAIDVNNNWGQISVNNNVLTINPTNSLNPNTTYYVQMASGVITDTSGNAFGGIADTTTLNFTTVDTAAPTLVSSTPADEATAVAVGNNVVLTFSETVQAGTGNIVISNGADTRTISVSDATQVTIAGNTVTINPTADLVSGAYHVQMASGVLTDLAGNAYAGITDMTTLNFTVDDATAPTLSSSTPADNAITVAVDGNIVLTFSEAIKAGTGNIVISNGSDTQTIPIGDIFGQVAISGNTLTINPMWDLQINSTYSVQMASGVITDMGGNPYAGISDATTLNFTTPDSVAPTLASSTPTDNLTGVAIGNNIVLTFSEQVKAGTGNIVVTDGVGDTRTISVTDATQVTFSGTTVTINPTADLALNTTYSVQMASGVITDLTGNAYAGIADATTLNFTTLDPDAPTLVSSTPADNATAVVVGGNIVLTFSKAVQAGTGNIVISNGTDTQTIPIGDVFGQIAISGSTLTINPLWDLQPNSTYSVQMASGVITDLTGHPYIGITDATTLNFSTTDTLAPTLASSTPADNALSVAAGSNIVLTFSEAVQAGSGNIVISDGTDTRTISVTDATQVTFSGTTVTINPTADLNINSSYHVQMASGVITDTAGNAYAGITDSTTLNFSTTDTIAPTLSSAVPADNATAVAVGNNIILTFSEAVQAGSGNIVISDGASDVRTISVTDPLQVSISGNVVTINPMFDLTSGSSYSVQLASGVITDLASNAYAGIGDATTLNFTAGVDTTAPLLSTSTPADNATAVLVGGNIVLTFNEQIKAGTGDIVISNGSDTQTIPVGDIFGQVSISGNVLTINPMWDLQPNSTYYVQMASGVITDTSGNAFAGISDTTTLNFATQDTLAPTLVSSTPADNATAVALGSNIVLTFSEAVQAGTGNIVISNGVDTRTISVSDATQVTISGTTVTINPTADLINGSYYVQMASGVLTDLQGNAYAGIADTTTLNFMVNDVTAPTLLSSTPADNAIGVTVTDNIVLTFSEAIQAGTGNIVISNGTDTQTIPVGDIFGQISISGNVLTINPMWDLQPNSTYYVQMASGVLKDVVGNSFAGISDTTTLNFSTTDTVVPTLVSSTPVDGASAVAVGSDIVLTFSEAVQAGTGNIVISNGAGDTRTISVTDASQVTFSGTTVTINPTADLGAGTYSVQMASGVITDLGGNAYAGITDTTTLSFSTPDTMAPLLMSALPADEATAVAVGNNIILTFSEAMQIGTGDIVISNGTDTQTIPVTDTTFGQVSISGNVVTINPLWDLQLGSTYYVQMASGVLQDLAGNPYAGISDTTTLNFTTGADSTAPTLSGSTPADNATAVAVGNSIVLTFNEQVKAGTGSIVISDGASDTRTINLDGSTWYVGSVTISGNKVTIDPLLDLNPNTTYSVQMASGVILDTTGNAYAGIATATTLNFTTTDTVAPTLVSSAPADDATGILENTSIALTFSEAVQAGVGNIVISNGVDTRTIDVTDASQVTIVGSNVLINPTTNLISGNYHVQMASGVITDLEGNAYAGISDATTLNFAVVDTTAPTLASSTPADNATAIAVGSNVVLTFDETVQAGTGDIVISNGTDTRTINVTDTSQVTFSGSTVTINPALNLQTDTTYYVQLASGVITDTAGNAYTGISDTTTLNFSTPDTIAPTLASSTPADNATAIVEGGNIVLTFSEAVQAGTGNIVISDGAGDTRTIAVGDAQVTIVGNTVTINPTADLLSNTAYNVQLASGVITDTAGNAYAGITDATTLNFTTGDTLAPTLASSTPADNATAVAVGSSIVLTFSEAVQAGAGSIVINDGVGDTRTIAVSDATQVTISGNTVTINPTLDLNANTTYYVQLASGVIEDLAGNAYAGINDTTTLNFSTPDTIAPTLASSTPADNATAVAENGNIVLTFSEAVQAGMGDIVISDGAGDTRTISVSDATQVTISGNTVTINPTTNLNSGTAYNVQMASGVLTDLTGNAYAGISNATTLNFTTDDTVTPTLVSSTPADDSTAILIGSNIVLTFSENVAIGFGNILISNGAGDTRTIDVTDATQVSVSGNSVTINPTADLNPDTAYYVRIAAGAITDVAGNAYAGISNNHTLNFTTQDTVVPTLASASPADNAYIAALGSNIVLTFSEAVQAGVGDIVISDGADTRTISVSDATQVTISGTTVTINPTLDLNANTTYYVQLASGVIEDLQGNAYAGIADTTTLNFTTDSVAPTLSGSNPNDNATAVALGSNIVLTFSEAVQAGTGNIVISDGAGDTRTIAVGDAQVTIVGNTVTINPTADLNANSSYSVQLASGVITDLAGNAYAGISNATTLNFSTPDTVAPTLASSTPADNATGIVVGNNIVLTFSEAVQAGAGNIVISDGAGDTRTIAVGDATQVTISGNTVTINPTADLNINSSYNVQMASGVLTDLAGNAYAGIGDATTLNFATTDTLAPTLASSSPADNATGIAKGANIVLTFNEAIKAGAGSIIISNSVDDSRTINITDTSQVTISGNTLTINPTLDLQSSNGATAQVYNVQMAAGAITDMYDNAFAGITDATTLNFTVADSVAPTLSSSTPADNVTAVAIGSNIVLTFSETVQAGAGNIVISNGTDTRTIAVGDVQVTIVGDTVTINPTLDLDANSTYYVQMASGVLTDASGNAYAGISDTTTLNFNTADTVAPTLVSSAPADNATQVAVTGNIVLTFSEAVQAGAGNIVISDGAGDTRTIAVGDGTQVSFSGSTVTINPTLDLATDKTYYVQMASGVIKDLENNNYAGIADTTTLNFTTTDTIVPTLASSTPADNTLNVAEGADIVLTFSEDVQAGTGNIVISNGAGDTRTISVADATQVTITGNTVTINPTANLQSNSAYNVKMASGVITDMFGNAYAGIASATTLNFSTADTTAPTLASSSPADDATQVTVGSNIVLTFNENVQAGTGNIVISDGAGDTRTIDVTDATQVTFLDNVVTINPTADLAINKTYNVQMASGVIDDYAGNHYAGIGNATTLNFNTTDTIAPTLASSSPSDNAYVANVGANIVLTFNEAVQAGTGNIVISDGAGDTRTIAVGDTSQVTFSGTTVTINPTASLAGNTGYYVQMASGVIADAHGNAYAGISDTTTLNFTTDTIAPTLASSSPADNATSVVKSSNIVLTFSEAVAVGSGNIIITDGAGDTRTISVSDAGQVSISGNIVTINPTFDLLSSGAYHVTMASGVLTDLAGNAYAGISDSTTLNFTVADTVAPTLTTKSPADDATAVAVGSNIVLTFNEAVEAGVGNIIVSDGAGDTRMISVTDITQVTFSGSTMTINPTANLNSDSSYYVQFAAGVVTDLAGNAFAGITTMTDLNFSTPDTIAPTLTGSTPTDNATGIAGGNNIVLTFSEDVQAGTGSIVISDGTNPWTDDIRTISITDTSQVTISGNTVTINPTSDLVSSGHYNVQIGSGVIEDLAGNNYAGLTTDTALDFTILDTTAPTLDASNSTPAAGSATYSRSGEIILMFDETIQLGTSGTIEIHNYFGTDSIKKSYNVAAPGAAGATITIVNGNEVHLSAPGTALAADTKYYFTISAGAIKDAAGNSLAAITTADYNTLSFTTSADVTAPTLASSTPADNAIEIPIGNDIVLTFNEDVKAGTGNIVLTNSTNGADTRTIAVTDTSQVTISGTTVTINPTANLVGGDSYYVTMASGVILDIAGNAYAGISASTTLNFTTLDTTPPTLASSSPTDESSGFAVGANITLTFSENIAKGTGYIQLTGSDGDIRMIDVTSGQVTILNKVVTINPTADLHADTTYTVRIDSGAITDSVGNDYAGISSDTTLNFSTASNVTNIATYGTVNGTTSLVPELLGTSAADTTSGGLVGGSADNTLTGGMGADILTGNGGSDVFIVALGYHPDATALNNATTALNNDKADGDLDGFVGSDDTMPIDENLVADHSVIAANRQALENQHTADNDVKTQRGVLNFAVWWYSPGGPGASDPDAAAQLTTATNNLNLHKAIYGEDAAVNQKEADSLAALNADIADHGSTAALTNRVTLEQNYSTALTAYNAASVNSHSMQAGMDQITDFAAGTDTLHLLDHSGADLASPSGIARVDDIATCATADLAATLQTAFSGVITANAAGIVVINAGTAAGTYLYINDGTVTYDTTADVFVNLTGMTGLGGDGSGVDPLTLSDYFSDTIISGTAGDDTLNGSALDNQIKGDLGADTLTGGGGQDVFVEAFGLAGGAPVAPSSTIGGMDLISDFKVGADTIHLTDSSGLDVTAPTALTRVADEATATPGTLESVLSTAFAGIGADEAGLVVVTGGASAGTYLYVNDGTAAFDTATDVFVNLTGITGLEAVGSLTVNHYIA